MARPLLRARRRPAQRRAISPLHSDRKRGGVNKRWRRAVGDNLKLQNDPRGKYRFIFYFFNFLVKWKNYCILDIKQNTERYQTN